MLSYASNPILSFSSVQLKDPPRIFISEQNWHWIGKIPDYYNIWYAIQGEGQMKVDGATYPITAGDIFILAPGQHVDALHNCNNPIHNFAAHFVPVNARGVRVIPRELPLLRVQARDPTLLDVTARHIVRLGARPGTGSVMAHWLYGLIWQAVDDARAPGLNPVDARIRELAETLASNPARRITVDQLAAQAGLSRVHFSRRFRHITGETPSGYIIRRRIGRAKELMQHSPMSLKEIAATLGYDDVFFFSRQFKQETGHSPGAWRVRLA